MINSEEKLEQFKSSVLSEVQRKAEKIVSDAKQESARMTIDISDRHFSIAEKKIEEGKTVIRSRYAKETQSCRIEARRALLRHRQELVDRIFDAIEQGLKSFSLSSEYPQYLQGLIKENGTDGGEIRLAAKDYERRAELLGECAEGFTVGCDEAMLLGGLKLIPRGGRSILDLSLDTALELQKESFSSSFDLKLE